jgi:CubicO group peptidase (beta-lactamase class C family)
MRKENSRSMLIVSLVLISLLIGAYCQGYQEMDIRENKEAWRILESYDTIIPVLMEEQKIPALSIALVDREGIIWSNCFGSINHGNSPNNPETMFSIQSISKTFTAVAILAAVDEGILDLDTPVKAYIPGFRLNSYYDEKPLEEITLRHLLSHKAGLVHEAPVGNNYTYDAPSFEEHVKSIQETDLRYPIGQRYSYSNLGIDLAAYILQEVSGMPFHQYLKEKVLDPLNMKHSSANPDVILASENRAAGFSRGREESRVIVPMQGAGGFYASMEDLASFVRFHLNQGSMDGKEIIPGNLLSEMYFVPFQAEGQINGYGLGIASYDRHQNALLNHSGGGYGYLADMAWYKDLGLGMVVLTNSVNHRLQGSLYREILDKLIEADRGKTSLKKEKIPEPGIEISAEDQKLYCGNYVGRFGKVQVIRKEGQLGLKQGNKFTPFTFSSKDEASLPRNGYHDYLRFVLDEKGKMDYIVKLNGGEAWDYNDGPNDEMGPDNPLWNNYLGKYDVFIGKNRITSATLKKNNGYLYLHYMNNTDKLQEMETNVFSNCKGELLRFGEQISFASIFTLEKSE